MTILIAGGSCSGKSTLARALVASLPGATHLPLDQFFRRDDPNGPQIEVNDKLVFDCNHPETIDLPKALAAIDQSSGFLIVDSHFGLYHSELRSRADFKVFIDCRAEIREQRRVERDSPARGTHEEVLDYYRACAVPGYDRYIRPSIEFADFVLDGTLPVEELVNQARQQIQIYYL